jgi:diaminohydroxyphosphoribosylaminopyrimidine deaminase/5-amino-6-(5-phosphoribosylamino)uracil reductase
MTRPPQDSLEAAMRRALALAAAAELPMGPNPRVGCVLVADGGATVAEGFHRGAGSAHAEVDALVQAGPRARGTTAVVTLEPCAHTGRTGPCTQALIGAGVVRVVVAQTDPNPVAAGGAQVLRAAGIEVETGLLADESAALNEAWTFAVTHGRPFVTWKAAATLDGRIAAADGTSRWITSPESRAEVHTLRAEVGAVVVGTGTVLVDDPHLAVRRDGALNDGPQPLRVVVGLRDVPAGSRVLDDAAETLHLRTHDPRDVVAELQRREVRHALLEGGPTLAAAFVRAGLVDAVRWYAAPALLGAGQAALDDAGMHTIGQALRLDVVDVARVGADIRIDARVRREGD